MNLGYVGLNCILERAFDQFGKIHLKLRLRFLLMGCRGYDEGLVLANSGVGLTIEFREVVEGRYVPGLEVLVDSFHPNDLL